MHPSVRHLAFVLGLLLLWGCTGCDLFKDSDEDVGPAEVVWSHRLTGDVVDNTRPVIEDGHTYVAADHSLRAFDLETGEKIWETRFNIAGSISAPKLLHEGGRLYLNEVSRVWAVAKEDGHVIWKTSIENFQGSGSIMTQNATHLFLGADFEVVRIRKSDGAIDLRIPVDQLEPEEVEQIAYNPVVSGDGILYVPTGFYREDFGVIEGNLLVYNARTGEYLWGFDIPNPKVKLPGRQDSTYLDTGAYGTDISEELVVFPAGQTIYALDRFTGEKEWETFFEDDAFDLGVTVKNGVVYAGSLQGLVYALDLQTGAVLWQTQTLASVVTILTIKGERVYFCNEYGGELWVLDAETGEVIWHGFPPEYEENRSYTYLSPLAVGEGYMVNVGSHKIYCLTVP